MDSFNLNNAIQILPSDLEDIALYIYENRNYSEKVIDELGELESTNDRGLFVLTQKNKLLSSIVVYTYDRRIYKLSIVGNIICFSINDLFSSSDNIENKYIPYDNMYFYRFFFSKRINFGIEISSREEIAANNPLNNENMKGFSILVNVND